MVMTKQIEAQQDTPAVSMQEVMERLAEYVEPDPLLWAALAQQIAWSAHDALPDTAELPALEEQRATIDRLIGPDSREHAALSDAASEATFEAIGFGARLGFALARTWPGSPDGLADWPAAAWRYADMGDRIARKRRHAVETLAYRAKWAADEAKRAADRAARQAEQPESEPPDAA
jgi:hypothetical protein